MSADLSQKVTHIEDMLKDLSSQMSDMQNQMAGMQKNTNEIYTSIVGDEKFGHKGLVLRVRSLEDTKKKYEKKAVWVYGYIVGAGTLLTVFFELIKDKLK